MFPKKRAVIPSARTAKRSLYAAPDILYSRIISLIQNVNSAAIRSRGCGIKGKLESRPRGDLGLPGECFFFAFLQGASWEYRYRANYVAYYLQSNERLIKMQDEKTLPQYFVVSREARISKSFGGNSLRIFVTFLLFRYVRGLLQRLVAACFLELCVRTGFR